MARIPQLLNQPLPVEDLDPLQRSIECICEKRGVSPDSDEADEIVRRALILCAGITDESDLRQALRRPAT